MKISVIEKKSLQDSDYLFHEILIKMKISVIEKKSLQDSDYLIS